MESRSIGAPWHVVSHLVAHCLCHESAPHRPLWPIRRRKKHTHQETIRRVSLVIWIQCEPHTRNIRPGEVDGQSYHFVTRDEFEQRVRNGEFLEHAVFGGNMYGTTAQAVRDVHEKGAGRRAILDIDAQGVRLIKQNHPDLNPIYVFISPPTFGTLKERLEGRATDSKDAIERRLNMALDELAYARQPHSFDCIIVNQDLAKAYEKLRAVIQGEVSVPSDSVPPEDEAERLRRSS